MAVAEVSKDESLRPLLSDEFDAKAFAAGAIHQQMVGEMLHKLSSGITELDNEIYSQVVTHYEDLLSQATGIEALEGVLKMMHIRIESLGSAVDRINSKILEPYSKIMLRTTQLRRLQAACDLLRKVIRMLYLMKRLRALTQAGPKEIAKMAQIFSEIDHLNHGNELLGIEVIEDEKSWLSRTRMEVESQAKKMLLQGLEHTNPVQVGVALQVFYNMSQLENTLVFVLTGYKNAVQHAVQNAVDPSSLLHSSSGSGVTARSGTPSSASWKASLWTQLEKLTNSLLKLYRQVHQLDVVLSKKRDPVSQTSFLATITGSKAHKLLTGFWEIIVDNITVELSTAAKASLILNQTFEADYPKLVKTLTELLTQIDQVHTQKESSDQFLRLNSDSHTSTLSQQRQEQLLQSLAQFEKPYISRSFGRLSDTVNQLFSAPSRGLPREDEILSLVKLMASELSVAGSCDPLGSVLGQNASKTVQLVNAKCEQLVLTGWDSLQVSGPPNQSQLRNISIVNLLHLFEIMIQQQIFTSSTINAVSIAVVKQAVEQTRALKVNTMSLFTDEVKRVLEKMVASMHKESFAADSSEVTSDSSGVTCSSFMKEMVSFINRVSQQHLSHYQCPGNLQPLLTEIASRVLELYVRHVCLIRPLGEAGKMRVTSDMAQLELALALLCPKVAELGLPYRRLRSLRRLLFLPPDSFLSTPAGVGDTLPYSYLLNFLFSKAPKDMKSPHQLSNWFEEDYTMWMDKHTQEKDRLSFIQATMNSYAMKVRGNRKDSTQLPQIYSVMSSLLKLAQDGLS